MKQTISVALVVAAATLLVSFVYNRIPGYLSKNLAASSTIQIKGHTIHITTASTSAERERGLSGRESLQEDEGMLFIFEESGFHAFWMKDMNFPIDIVWISYSGEIVDIREAVSPDTYPSIFTPRQPARYVLELPAGSVREYSVRLGDRIDF